MHKGKGNAGLALVFGDDADSGDEMDDEDGSDPMEDFRELAGEIFPDVDPDKLKELIHLCMEAGYEAEE
jgi:major membrane immunogen (membrane-anchored lipoprotein)